jgi:poly-gamma-glutamate synthesis protein (capsule biosynthesis protein)
MKPTHKLLLVGDIMLGRMVNEALRDERPGYPWGDTLSLFHKVDWRACNLECVISDHGSPWARSPKTFHFRSDSKNIAVLQAARIDAVSLANNHTLDFNHRGMVEMLRLLDGAHVNHCGAGLDIRQASRLAISEVRGMRIGMLSFTDNEPEWEAGMDHPGIHYVPIDEPDERTTALLSLVSHSRTEVDLLIVAAHWGGNWGNQPPITHTRLAHDLIRAGANVICGHSPHVSRGIEVFQGGLILYSTGDFIDDYAIDPVERNDRTWAFEIQAENSQITSFQLHPIVISHCQAHMADPEEARAMLVAMQELCTPLGTSSVVSSSLGTPSLVISVQESAGICTEPLA